jgi:Fe-Mn family superoxide dismutase
MAYELPPLPYAKDALAPHLSAETLEFHHGKHHNAYVVKLNELASADPELQGRSYEQLIVETRGKKAGAFNQAAQVWNHTFYWNSLSPKGGGAPTGRIAGLIDEAFGSFDAFKAKFAAAAAGQFGSGWAWLVQNEAGQLEILTTSNAETPVGTGKRPLLTCDVWEHAYYIDFRNARPKYVEAWWNLVNWDFANANLG